MLAVAFAAGLAVGGVLGASTVIGLAYKQMRAHPHRRY